jgi:putative transposase
MTTLVAVPYSLYRGRKSAIVKLSRHLPDLVMNSKVSRYHRYRVPAQIIGHPVWLYHRFRLSFRDVEELLAERDTIVSLFLNTQGKRRTISGGLSIRMGM